MTLGEGAVVGADSTVRPLRDSFRNATQAEPFAEVLRSRTPALLTGLDGLAPCLRRGGPGRGAAVVDGVGRRRDPGVTARGNTAWDPDEVARLESVADLAAVAQSNSPISRASNAYCRCSPTATG